MRKRTFKNEKCAWKNEKKTDTLWWKIKIKIKNRNTTIYCIREIVLMFGEQYYYYWKKQKMKQNFATAASATSYYKKWYKIQWFA